MQLSGIPPKFPIPFANSAGSAYIRSIPVPSQIGIQNGAASLTDGFPPLTFVPEIAGGVPPFGEDFNGILQQITAWVRWSQAAGPVAWDSAFSAAIGGYPSGALVRSNIVATDFWISTADNNVTNPDTGGAGWAAWGDGTGREQFRPTQESLYGWVVDNGTTIGNAASNATQRANADTQLLFAWYWNNFASLTIYTSGGAPTARGVSAAADYAANRAIATLTRQGMSVTGMDTMGGAATTKLASVPVTSGNATTAGSVLGENLHTLTIPELAEHDHTITTSASTIQVQVGTGTSVGAQVIAGQHVSMTGSNTPHNNVPLTQLGTWYRKL